MRREGARLSPAQRHRLEAMQLRIDMEHNPGRLWRESRRRAERARRSRLVTRTALLGLVAIGALHAAACLAVWRGDTSNPSASPAAAPALRDAIPGVLDVRAEVISAARDERVPPGLLAAVVKIESAWRIDARGKAGEIGLTQLMPATARQLGVNAHDVRENLRGGARYLRAHYDRTGTWTEALVAYNGRGPAARRYAQRVLRAWESGE